MDEPCRFEIDDALDLLLEVGPLLSILLGVPMMLILIGAAIGALSIDWLFRRRLRQ